MKQVARGSPCIRSRPPKGLFPQCIRSLPEKREAKKFVFAQGFEEREGKKLSHNIENLKPVPTTSMKPKFMPPLGCRNLKPRY